MIQAIRDNDPVIFFEHKALYDLTGPVPEESYALPFGEANVVREGGDVTIVTLGRMVHTSLEAASQLAADSVQCEVIDLRTTSPLDEDTVLESMEGTGAGRSRRVASPVLDRHRHLGARRAEGLGALQPRSRW